MEEPAPPVHDHCLPPAASDSACAPTRSTPCPAPPLPLAIDPNFIIDAAEALGTPALAPLIAAKTRPEAFRIVKTLAKGGYGEVFLVEYEGQIFAMKRVPKQLVLRNINTTFFMNEKEIMTTVTSDWLVRCHAAIQDDVFLYYIMDFIPGGDLMGYLSKRDIISESEIRFYAAEISAAVAEMHRAGWIHRDLKPDNILIDRAGHVKLGDFGSSIRMVDGRAESSLTVGTPDYVSPDLLVSVGATVRYGPEVDFWTLGVILYEMHCGTTPFYSESLKETYAKISAMEYAFPADIPPRLRDLIIHLLCPRETRYGFAELQAHPFFEGVDWARLRSATPPYVPVLRDADDISNFVETEFVPDSQRVPGGFKEFIGFTHDPRLVERVRAAVLASGAPVGGDARILRSEDAETLNMEDALVSMAEALDMKGAQGAVPHACAPHICCATVASHALTAAEELSAAIAAQRKELAQLKAQRMSLAARIAERTEEATAAAAASQHALAARAREDLNAVTTKLATARADLANTQRAVAAQVERLAALSRASPAASATAPAELCRIILGDVQEIHSALARIRIDEALQHARRIAYMCYRQAVNYAQELSTAQAALAAAPSGDAETRRQLRIKKTEIREYQQRLEQEATLRRRLEEELAAARTRLQRERTTAGRHVFSVLNATSNKPLQAVFEGGAFELLTGDGTAVEHRCPLSALHVSELKNNELHHLSYRKRALSLRLHFLKDVARSTSSGARRSLRALGEELAREEKILEGLDGLLAVLDGATRAEADAQRRGSARKIEQLRAEIERAKRSTITEVEINDNEKVYEYNNHLFYEKTVAKGTLCDHCNEVLYGIINQALCCRDCLMVVHKSCYVLGDVSCELSQAMRAGTSVSVVCASLEERARVLRLANYGDS